MPTLYPYNVLAAQQTSAPGEVLTEAMEVETSDEEEIRLEGSETLVELSPGSAAPARHPTSMDTRHTASAGQACALSDSSGSVTETGVVLEMDSDQAGLIQELHVQELTDFEQEEARRLRKQKKKAKRKKIRKRIWRAVRVTWKYVKRAFSGYAPTPGIINSFTWGVNLPPELFKNPPTKQ